jgi:hypothetical protein
VVVPVRGSRTAARRGCRSSPNCPRTRKPSASPDTVCTCVCACILCSGAQVTGFRSAFAVTQQSCDSFMFELINGKIDTFISLAATINWLPSGAQVTLHLLRSSLPCLGLTPLLERGVGLRGGHGPVAGNHLPLHQIPSRGRARRCGPFFVGQRSLALTGLHFTSCKYINTKFVVSLSCHVRLNSMLGASQRREEVQHPRHSWTRNGRHSAS